MWTKWAAKWLETASCLSHRNLDILSTGDGCVSVEQMEQTATVGTRWSDGRS